MVSLRVAPSAYEPSRSDCGTALITSSESELTKGMIITPMTRPAASPLSELTDRPKLRPRSRMSGATTRAAKKP